MSYCRWSSDDFKCDLYVYASIHDNYTIHIAGRRYIDETREEMIDIDLPFAGSTFALDTLEELKKALLALREIGYCFPDYVLQRIDEEMEEENDDGTDNSGI